jgi:hypothetical protein
VCHGRRQGIILLVMVLVLEGVNFISYLLAPPLAWLSVKLLYQVGPD